MSGARAKTLITSPASASSLGIGSTRSGHGQSGCSSPHNGAYGVSSTSTMTDRGPTIFSRRSSSSAIWGPEIRRS